MLNVNGYIHTLTLAKYQAEKHLKHEIILFDNCEVEEGRGDTAESEASPEHEADTEQAQGQDVTQDVLHFNLHLKVQVGAVEAGDGGDG